MEYQEIKRNRRRISKFIIGAFSILMLTTLILGNNLFALFLQEATYNESSQSQSTQEVLQPITVPTTIHIVVDTERSSTQRDRENVSKIMQQVTQIWSQAAIDFDYQIVETVLDGQASESIDRGTYAELIQNYGYEDSIQLFFVRELNGIYGVAIPGRIGIISDIIPAGGFRTTAHEVGHLLGLPHTTESRTRLMSQGATGIELSAEEISSAREVATFYK